MSWIMLITIPGFVIAALLKDKGGLIGRFVEAGAHSEKTARRLDSVGATRIDRLHLADLVRAGALVDVGDGRYWVDRVADKRRRRRHLVIACVLGLVLGLLGITIVSQL